MRELPNGLVSGHNGVHMFRLSKVKKAVIKIAIAATASDGAILEKTDVSALSRALIHFDIFRDMTVDKIRRLADETLAEIKSAAAQGRIVEEVAKACQLLKKNDNESIIAMDAALFMCLYDGELCGNEVGYMETLTVNLQIPKASFQKEIEKISAFIEVNKDELKKN